MSRLRSTPVLLLFLLWIAFGLVEPKKNATMRLYADYARTARTASLRTLYDESWVEYPPLAVGLMIAADATADALAPVWRAVTPPQPDADTERIAFFGRTYGLFGLLIQIGVFAAVWRTLRSEPDRGGRLLVMILAWTVLTNLTLQRLDAIMAALVLASLLLLVRGRWAAAFAVLAAGGAFKLVPLALAPVWVLASLPPERLRLDRWFAGRFLGRGLLIAAFTAAWVAPFVVVGGPRALAFLTYHEQRGVQCESTYAAGLTVAQLFGYPVHPHEAFGSYDLDSAISPALVTASSGVLLIALAAVYGVAFVALRRPGRDHLTVAAIAALGLMAFAGCGKVFSPQYVLWVVPLVALFPLRGRRWVVPAAFLAACLLTRVAYPVFVAEGRDGGPVPLTATVLVARTVLWFGLMAWLARIGRVERSAGGIPVPIVAVRQAG